MTNPDLTTTTVTVGRRRRDGKPDDIEHRTVLANTTDTPGLVITPKVTGTRMTGDWTLTHAPSGLCLPIGDFGSADIYTVRRVADELGRLPIDWTVDQEQLAGLVNEHAAAIRDAIRDGRYPEPSADSINPAVGAYPVVEADATAGQLASFLTRKALELHVRLMQFDLTTDDQAAREAWIKEVESLNGGFGLASVLRSFRAVDERAADAAALWVWEQWQAGESIGEWLHEWASEYGLPKPDGGAL